MTGEFIIFISRIGTNTVLHQHRNPVGLVNCKMHLSELRRVPTELELLDGQLTEPMVFQEAEPRPGVHLAGFLSQKEGAAAHLQCDRRGNPDSSLRWGDADQRSRRRIARILESRNRPGDSSESTVMWKNDRTVAAEKQF